MQANALLGRTAGRGGGRGQHGAVERAEDRGHAVDMTRKQEVENEFEVQWSISVSFRNVNILSLEATGWHA